MVLLKNYGNGGYVYQKLQHQAGDGSSSLHLTGVDEGGERFKHKLALKYNKDDKGSDNLNNFCVLCLFCVLLLAMDDPSLSIEVDGTLNSLIFPELFER
ncbi:unnamed protein product [Microthlaspi erraticum]|uniref:Uncharacterized protein n=1 Tax=Microthlaspi erraticum TaxID=1685480 RepID=A0A6D2K3C2_9BRAS|nr:unnamed protein product [Microthlaspi erraticum]